MQKMVTLVWCLGLMNATIYATAHTHIQIANVDDPNQGPIQRSQPVSCGTGVCSGTVSLSGDGELSEGVRYIVGVAAANRYGQSETSGKSDPFIIGDDGTPQTTGVYIVYSMLVITVTTIVCLCYALLLSCYVFSLDALPPPSPPPSPPSSPPSSSDSESSSNSQFAQGATYVCYVHGHSQQFLYDPTGMGAGVAVGVVITSIVFVVVLVILRAIANFGSKKGKLSMNVYVWSL